MRVVVLGAGASKAYSSSKSGCTMPMARDFFKTYQDLSIAADRRVLVDKILLFGKDYLNLNYDEMFEADLDIEDLHTRIEYELLRLRLRAVQPDFGIEEIELMFVSGAYDQLIFLFASVLNEIQNGPVSEWHLRLANALNAEDRVPDIQLGHTHGQSTIREWAMDHRKRVWIHTGEDLAWLLAHSGFSQCVRTTIAQTPWLDKLVNEPHLRHAKQYTDANNTFRHCACV